MSKSFGSFDKVGKYFLITAIPSIKYSANPLSKDSYSKLISASDFNFRNRNNNLCDLVGTFEIDFNKFIAKEHSSSCKLESLL